MICFHPKQIVSKATNQPLHTFEMAFINYIVSLVRTWMFTLITRISAAQVVSQPDNYQPDITSTNEYGRLKKANDYLLKENFKLRRDLNRQEYENQQELAKLKRQQRQLEDQITKLLASKGEESEKIENLQSNCDIVQKEMDNLRSDVNYKEQQYQNELAKLIQSRAVLAEKNTRLLAMKDLQLEKIRNVLSHRKVFQEENDQLRREFNRQKQKNQKENEELRSEVNRQKLQYQKENDELCSEVNRQKLKFQKESEKLRSEVNRQIQEFQKEKQLLQQFAEEKDKILALKNSKLEELEKLLSNKEKLTRNQKEEHIDLGIPQEPNTMKSSPTYVDVKPATRSNGKLLPETEQGNKRKVYSRDTIMQLKNSVASTGIREHLLGFDLLREPNNLKSSPTNVDVKPKTRSFGQLLPETEQGRRPIREIKLMRSQDVPRNSDNPNVWKPKRASLKTEEVGVKSTEATLKTVRGILNKVTPSNYEKLVKKVQEVNIDDQDCLADIIDIFFAKAVDEPIFSPIYAKMCLALSAKDVVSSSNPAETVSFRRLLLSHCQKGFEKDTADLERVENKRKEVESARTKETEKQLKDELNELVDKNRRVSLGNIKFIGELFKVSIITFKIMHQCIRQLLDQHEDEESLECLCKLLTTIGKELEIPSAADEAAKSKHAQFMFSVIQRLKTIIGNQTISIRIRFMVQGVLEMRESGWKPRRAENGPKTIEQIHKEIEQEINKPKEEFVLPQSRKPSRRQTSFPKQESNMDRKITPQASTDQGRGNGCYFTKLKKMSNPFGAPADDSDKVKNRD